MASMTNHSTATLSMNESAARDAESEDVDAAALDLRREPPELRGGAWSAPLLPSSATCFCLRVVTMVAALPACFAGGLVGADASCRQSPSGC